MTLREELLAERSFGFFEGAGGPYNDKGEESFCFTLCTPEWFAHNMPGDIALGRHHLFVREYNFERIEAFVRSYCASCEGPSPQLGGCWGKVARLGQWEFEDYKPD